MKSESGDTDINVVLKVFLISDRIALRLMLSLCSPQRWDIPDMIDVDVDVNVTVVLKVILQIRHP